MNYTEQSDMAKYTIYVKRQISIDFTFGMLRTGMGQWCCGG